MPASLDLEASSLSGLGLLSGVAGSKIYLTVVPRDTFGNVWRQGPLDFQAEATMKPYNASVIDSNLPVPVSVTDTSSGTAQVSFVSDKVSSHFRSTDC